jgi:uncharacterized protein (DUF58 family)
VKRKLGKRAFIVALVSGLLFLAGATAQASWLFVLAAGVLSLVLGSLFIRHPLKAVEVERKLPRRVRQGDEVRLGLIVRNNGRRTLPLTRLDDPFPAFEPNAALIERLGPGEQTHIELVSTARRRGDFASGEVKLTSGAPFGFLRSSRTLEVGTPLVVVPRWFEIRSFPILEPSSFPSDVLHERARTGAGEEFIGVRDYRPGDPPRSVHWRSTARAGHLIVREFEEELASHVVLVLAGADTGEPPDSAFESLVTTAATIGIYALQTGHPVDMVRATPGGGAERLGDTDRYGLLDWLAKAEPVDAPLTALVGAAVDRIGRRGTVVLLAPATGEAGESIADAVRLVQAGGSRAIVIVADARTWDEARKGPAGELGLGLEGGRATVRVISRGDDLARCIGS